MPFRNRIDAGRQLAQRLKLSALKNPIVIALPRGGVPVAYEIARELGAPLEVLVVRKFGAPMQPEYGIGATTEDGYYGINQEAAQAAGASESQISQVLNDEAKEVARRVTQYRQGRPFPSLQGKTAIVVDDGLATGVTARVASHYLKKEKGAEHVILAAPVCAPDTARALRAELDEVLCLEEPEIFFAVGQFYEDFKQTSDEEVIALLSRARQEQATQRQQNAPVCKDVEIREDGISLPGNLAIPVGAKGIVLFAHGSGSSRFSPRNTRVAGKLCEAGIGTLLFDLLTEEESLNRSNVFDIPLLASRLVAATRWVTLQPEVQNLPVGYFGASTGAGAALWAASDGDQISAIVSRGGRPDLAIPRLPFVTAPTLLLVGEYDEPVIKMNQEAMKYLATAKLVIIPGATHLFEAPGALELVADEAAKWFTKYLARKEVQHAAA